MDEIAPLPVYAAPPAALDPHVLAVEVPADALDGGFLLAGGVLAPLPAKVRLPHEEDEPEAD